MDEKKSLGMDMLHGPLVGKIIIFALPLIASGILQQSFIAVDVAVIGRYSTSQALAAVGSNGPFISILVNLFIGISIGANVVIANYIGRRNEEGIRRSISTVAALALISGILLMGVGLTGTRPILEWMNMPDDVIELAAEYLGIYFMGMPFMMVYNFGAAVMRSMGDTRRPFYSLLVAGLVNVALNLLFVTRLGMDVDGVAIATVISNGVNAAIMVWWLRREPGPFALKVSKMGIHRQELKKMLQIGVPAGLQGMVFSTANIFIQSAVNSFGSDVIAGSAAALNYEAYCYYIIAAFCQATVAFTSQNYGAGNHKRCKSVFKICMMLSVVFSAVANLLISWRAEAFLSLFTTDAEVMKYAVERVHYVLTIQFIASSYEISGSAMRGLGYSLTPMLLTVIGTCVLRLVWVYTVNVHYHTFKVLLIVYPITWVVTGALVMGAYYMVQRRVFAERVRTV